MPEHPLFELERVTDRAIVYLRVRPNSAVNIADTLELPSRALSWCGEDPAAHWMGPDHWLLRSDTQSADELIATIDNKLSGQLYSAVNMSSNTVCFSLRGSAARTLLAMGCSVDMHADAFPAGHCTRTHFSSVLLFIVAMADETFDLYIDRSLARHLENWIAKAGDDPLTHSIESIL